MAIVVSDTSPLRALHLLGLLKLPSQLFDEVFVPPAVRDELLKPRKRFVTIALNEIPGGILRAPANSARVARLAQELHAGEAEAIALAEETKARLLIDEMAGRTVASKAGLQITGVVGLPIEAKSRGLVVNVTPLLERLRNELGFYMSTKLIAEAKRLAGE